MLCLVQSGAQAEDPAPPQKKLILPGEVFSVEQRTAFVHLPAEELRREPQPWVWYAPTLPPYPDNSEKWMFEQFLAAGVAVAGIDVGESYGSPAGNKLFSAFYKEMVERRGFAKQMCLMGRSRGGMMVTSWACEHPERVAGIVGIYPVFDLRAYPGIERAAPAFGLSTAELTAQLDALNPIARAGAIIKAKVPVYLIHGDSDEAVPLETNSAALVERYRAAGAEKRITLNIAKGHGHSRWEGFFRCQPLTDFAIKSARDAVSSDPNE